MANSWECLATREQLLRFHTPRHVDAILKKMDKAVTKKKMVRIDGDTAVVAGSREAALSAKLNQLTSTFLTNQRLSVM